MHDGTPTGAGVTLVCSGGGVHGAAQAGMLAELFAAGFECDSVVGVSAGACNAVEIAASPTRETAERLCRVWESVDTSGVLPSSRRAQMVNLITNRSGDARQESLRSILRSAVTLERLEDTQIPVHIGAVDVATGETVWFSSGPVLDLLCASAALPGVFPPVVFEGRQLYDGGVTDSLPLRRAVETGARAIVALDVTKLVDSHEVSSHFKTLMRGIEHTREALRRAHIESVPPHTQLAVIRAGHAARGLGLTGEVAAGRELMRVWLEQHPLTQLPSDEPTRRFRWRRSAASALR